METSSSGKSVFMLHIAVMLFGLSGVIAKFVSVSSVTVTWGRVVCSACLLLAFMLVKKEPLRLRTKEDALILIISGLVLAAHWITFFQSVKTASVAIGTITFSTFPLFLVFLEPLVFREKFLRLNLLYSAILLAGVLIMVPEFSVSNQTTVGILWGMAGSLTYAVLSLMNRYLSGRYSGIKICFYEQLTVAVALLPVLFSIKRAGRIWGYRRYRCHRDCVYRSGIFLVCEFAQKKVKAQTAGIISGMEAVYGIFFALLLLHAVPSAREILGGILILGVAIVASRKA